MAVAWRQQGDGFFTPVFTTPAQGSFSLDVVYFEVITDATAGGHRAQLIFVDSSNETAFTCTDTNLGSGSSQYTYTFMRGATMNHCTLDNGDAVESPLPTTELDANTQLFIRMVNDSGTGIVGDLFQNAIIYGDHFADDALTSPVPNLPITLLPSAA
jgi:hypothetical protein